MESLSTNLTIIALFFVVLLIFVAFEFLSKQPKPNSYHEEKENQQNSHFNDSNEKLERRLRLAYWKKLDSIYDKKSTKDLVQAKEILEEMQSLHTSGTFNTNNFHDIDEWYLDLAKLRQVLDYPKWVDDDTNPKEYEMPLFIDLDIQYINDLLNQKNFKNQRTIIK